jgi:hypothetical protein
MDRGGGVVVRSPGSTVFRVKCWSEVYETADSRKHKALQWVSVPIGFDSDGFVRLVEEFGEDAPALYGAWIALVLVAARCPIRGVLSTSNGEPISEARLAFLSRFPSTVFGRLIEWAFRIGWLEVLPSDDVRLAIQKRDKNAQSITDRSANELPNRPNLTLPNLTQPHPTDRTVGGGGGVVDGAVDTLRVLGAVDFDPVSSEAVLRLAEALTPMALGFALEPARRRVVARVALAAGVRAEVLELVRACGASTTRTPTRYWAGGLVKIFSEAGVDFERSVAALEGLIATQKSRKVRAV